MNGTFYADRSERGKLRFSGPQDRWFLHQILTQAFEDMQPGDARDSAMITAHGRMVGYLEILATEDGLFAHFEPELKADLPDAIRRYVFATQVEIEDISDAWSLILVGGIDAGALGSLGDTYIHTTTALGVPAFYVWTRSPDDVIEVLRNAGAEAASEQQLEAIRIENGIARWGRDMDTKTFPQEAGIAERAVHFDKGCYVGQEAMAKIHFRGKVNRRLARISSDDPVEDGVELQLEGQRVGVVTSSTGLQGLAMVRYTVEPGATLTAGDREVAVVG
jgi:tRNA-modifying protein YgfZ